MRNSLLASILIGTGLYCAKVVIGGIGVGGGAPPSVDIPELTMMMLKAGAMNGHLIRYTEPGYDPIYLRPDQGSIKERSFSSVAMDTGNATVFYSLSDTEIAQAALARNLARSMSSTLPGVLPLLPDDLTFKAKPEIESVPLSEVDQETLMKIPPPSGN